MSLAIKRIAVVSCIVGGLLQGEATFAQTVGLVQVPVDNTSIFTLQGENSSVSAQKLTDRYYTNGLHFGYQSAQDTYSGLSKLSNGLWGNGHVRLSVNITQQIYTPADTGVSNPPLKDRPYAGVLLGTISAVQDSARARSSVGLQFGVVGSSALGETVQNGFHDLIGQTGNRGWHTQLHDEPVFAVQAARVWRLPTGSLLGFDTDILPGVATTLGNLKVNLEAGMNIRLGQGLQSDYGAPRINALGGGDAFRRNSGLGWYVFAGAGGQAVAHDITLDGNSFKTSRSVGLNQFVGQFDAGLAILAFGTRLSYTQVIQTQDFRHQKGGPHEFGSLALSVRF